MLCALNTVKIAGNYKVTNQTTHIVQLGPFLDCIHHGNKGENDEDGYWQERNQHHLHHLNALSLGSDGVGVTAACLDVSLMGIQTAMTSHPSR